MLKFYGLIISAFVISVFVFLKAFNLYDWNIFYLPEYNKVNVIVELNKPEKNSVFITANDKFYTQNDNKIFNVSLDGNIKEVKILIKNESNIDKLIIYNGTKAKIYKDLSNFEKTKQNFCYENICSDYSFYNIEINNKNSVLNTICAYLVSFMEGNKIFILPYILIFIALLYFKDKYIDKRIILFSILILCVLVRINNFTRVPVGDEYYSIMMTHGGFLNIFKDPGNPFVFYLMAKIYGFFFNYSAFSYRILSLIFALSAIILSGFLIKKKFNSKAALITMFIASISSGMIYYSSEIRSYSFQMLLSVILLWILFEIMQKRKNIYYVLYIVFGIIAINTHYYEALFLFSNFLFAIFYFGLRRKKDIFKFVLSNLFILLSFIPYFILTSYNNALLDSSFNTYLDNLSLDLINKQISFIFGSFISFILSVVFFIKIILSKKISKKRKLWLLYLLFSIFSIIILSIALSYLIRPMIAQRYYCLVLPLFAMFIGITFTSFKNKFYTMFFFIWIMLMNWHTSITSLRLYFEYEQNIFYLIKEENIKNNQYVLLRPTNRHFVQVPYNKTADNVKVEIVNIFPKNMIQSNVQNRIDEILDNDDNAVIYTSMLNPNKDNINDKKYSCYYNSQTDLCLWKISKKP